MLFRNHNKKSRMMRNLAAVLAGLCLLMAPHVRANPFTFTVVNDQVPEFHMRYRPWDSDKGMLLPHTLFTDTALNLRIQINDKNLTVYGYGKTITFQLDRSEAFTGDNVVYKNAFCYRVPVENGELYYMSADLLCEFFQFPITESDTEWGRMVRIRTPDNKMEDEQFLRFRSYMIVERYNAYFGILPSPSPNPTPYPTPSVSPGTTPSPVPTAIPPPSSPQPPQPMLEPVSVYVTIDGEIQSATPALLDFLEEKSIPVLFFLPPDSLTDDPDTLRRLVSRHQAGLLLAEPELSAIQEGNQILRETAFIKTWLIRSDKRAGAPDGYRYWGYTVRISNRAGAAALDPLTQKNLEPSAVVISLPHNENTVAILREVLAVIAANEAVIRPVHPGELPAK